MNLQRGWLLVNLLLLLSPLIACDLDNGSSLSPKSISDELAEMLKGGKASEALKRIANLTPEDNADPRIQLYTARAHLQLGRMNDGERLLLGVVDNSQSDTATQVEAAVFLGRVYIQGQRLNEAEKHLEQARKFDPSNYQALSFLGKVYIVRDEDFVKGLNYIQQAVAINPNDAQIQFELGMAYFQSDVENAHQLGREAFQAAAELNPTIDRLMLGRVYYHFKHPDWAAEEYQSVRLTR
jgi:tetratricopeptide (TPR) repeat protein